MRVPGGSPETLGSFTWEVAATLTGWCCSAARPHSHPGPAVRATLIKVAADPQNGADRIPDEWQTNWKPVTETADDVVSETAAAALHGLLDAPGPPPGFGDSLPPLWHWLAFLPVSAQQELGADGHLRIGRFMPPVPLPRRMFAGGSLRFAGAVTVGSSLHRESVVSKVDEKDGRTGPLVFVEVMHRIAGGDRASIEEAQSIVYRERSSTDGGAEPLPSKAHPGPDIDWTWRGELATDSTLLFRFSALTYNAHRIHYDRAYAMDVEGYPGLIVHGPLQAVALAELCRRNLPHRKLSSFDFRSLRPAFDGAPLHLRGGLCEGNTVKLEALDHLGQATMRATAKLAHS